MGNASRTITITFGNAAGPRDVVLTIRNWCSDAVVPGASVTISAPGFGPQTAIADAAGQVTFLQLEPGEYGLLISAAGYLDSSSDTLANDTLTV